MNEISQLKISDKGYPEILRQIPDPPKLLYYRGNLEALKKQPAIAVVGTRRCSDYGKQATEEIVSELAKAKITIVSGMAKGIDTYAHKTALQYKTATIAVLGSGIDDNSMYPQRNKKLAYEIIDSGGIIMSEYKNGTPGMPHRFPARNRIVAGLSCGVLAVEAPIKSGTLITARLAADYNRDIYAVPGSIFSRLSAGCNLLITNGAKSVVNASDILNELEINSTINFERQKINTDKLSKEEKLIYELIVDSGEDMHIDKIIQKLKLDTGNISTIITSLMLQDIIKETKPNHYICPN